MPVSSTHRFLYGRKPDKSGKRVWVCHGQIHDWFYHDLFHGCVDIRRTLELWALEEGLQLTVTLRHDGVLDFSGNPNPQEAQRRLESVQPRRPPRYSHVPGEIRNAQQSAQPAVSEEVLDQARERADEVRQSAAGEALLNRLTKLTNLICAKNSSALVLIEELPALLQRLENNHQSNIAVDILHKIKNFWISETGTSNLLVFLAIDKEPLEAILPRAQFSTKVDWIEVPPPKAAEIQAALKRLARRHGLSLQNASTIADSLVEDRDMCVALGRVIRLVRSGCKEINLQNIYSLPPIREEIVEELRSKLNSLVGLHEVKQKFERIERKARQLRKQFESGQAPLPEETMHLVFLGNPGTGKTTVARIMAKLFHALGILPRDEVIEISAKDIMSSTVGKTRENMQSALERARGAVLFIDEAHQFGDKDSPTAREAIDALVPAAWNLRRELVIILAGYSSRMIDFFKMDEGLQRRFPQHGRIEFRDYSLEELWEILERKLAGQGYSLDAAAHEPLRAVLRRRAKRHSFGNAGGVDNLVNEILENHHHRPAAKPGLITKDDLPPCIRQHPQVIEEAQKALEELVGLRAVREKVETLVAQIQYDLRMEESGKGAGEVHLHPGNMLFSGPPGTGKTTVGSIMAKLLYGIGCIERNHFVGVGRADLVGEFQGQTAIKVRKVIEQARDGVLFIDEAYGLVTGDLDAFGKEALTELVNQITNPENAGTVFILAGYQTELKKLLSNNPGLQSRFPHEICFENFTPDDCVELAQRRLRKNGYTWDDEAMKRIRNLAEEAIASQGAHFGNGRWVENLTQQAIQNMKLRVVRSDLPPQDPDYKRIKPEDLPAPQRTTTLTSSSGLAVPTNWTPQPDARRLASLPADLAELSDEAIGERVAACSYQIVVEDAGGKIGAGTGFFVTADGVMATSAHVVGQARMIQVYCGRNRAARMARVIRLNPDLDLALLAVDIEDRRPYLPLGDSLSVPPLTELIVFGNAHVQPGEPGRLIMARVARNSKDDPLHIETDGDIEPGFSGGPAVEKSKGVVVGIVRGGYGRSATLLVRSEQLMEILIELGYRFE